MKIILRSDVESLGRVGDLVNVKPGYARNYLIPQGMAMVASAGNERRFELERKKLEAKADETRAEAKALAEKLSAAEVNIEVRVGEGDKLYGSVTAANIGETLDAMGIELDKRKLLLDAPIRALGIYDIAVRLHPDVEAQVKVAVVKPGQTAADLVAAAEAAEAEETAEMTAAAEAPEAEVAEAPEVETDEPAADEAAEDVKSAE